MADDDQKSIKEWRAIRRRFDLVDQAFLERDVAYDDFARMMADTVRPHLDDLGIPIKNMVEAFVWRDILPQIPRSSTNYYRHGLTQLALDALEQPHGFYDEMLILEALCLYEKRIVEAWPEFAERFRLFRPNSQKEIAALATFTRGKAFPIIGEPVPPISEGGRKPEELLAVAQAAKLAAFTRHIFPERHRALRNDPKYFRAERLFEYNSPQLEDRVSAVLISFFEREELLPPPGQGRQILQDFLGTIFPRQSNLFVISCVHNAMAALGNGPEMGNIGYSTRLAATRSRLQKFAVAILGPIQALTDIPEM